MYQPRRVADPIEVAEPRPLSSGPRRAMPAKRASVHGAGSVALAVVTTAATASAVVFGSSGGSAMAAASTAEPSVPAPTLTASTLTTPALMDAASTADAALLSRSKLYTSSSLNVRAKADAESKLLGKLATSTSVSATADIEGDYRKVEYDDGYGWVLSKSLTDAAPLEGITAAEGTTMDPCPRGSAIEGKLRPDTIHIYRSVCALFPDVNSYGGWRSGGMAFHKNGRALDIMLTPHAESALGHKIANYLIAHAREFNIDHIIFEQQIWTPGTPRWRHMADRGGITANHFDHVHVAIRA